MECEAAGFGGSLRKGSPKMINNRTILYYALFRSCIAACCFCAFTGCATFNVKKGASHTQVPGIPFYIKQAACKHQTVYIEPYYVLTLTVKFPDKTLVSSSGVLSKSQFESAPVQQIRSIVGEKAKLDQNDAQQLADLWDKNVRGRLYNPYRPENQIKPEDKYILANTLTPEIYVSYTDADQYFYNVDRPVIGSVQASIKLGPDGTLSEASAQVEDKTVSTILSLFPVSDLIKTAASDAPAAAFMAEAVGAPPGAPTVELELKTERKGIKFTRTSFEKIQPPCQALNNNEVTEPYSLAVEDVGGGDKPDDGNNISVNGTIKLPKSQPAKDK